MCVCVFVGVCVLLGCVLSVCACLFAPGVRLEAVLQLSVSHSLRTLVSARCHASPLLPSLPLVGQVSRVSSQPHSLLFVEKNPSNQISRKLKLEHVRVNCRLP